MVDTPKRPARKAAAKKAPAKKAAPRKTASRRPAAPPSETDVPDAGRDAAVIELRPGSGRGVGKNPATRKRTTPDAITLARRRAEALKLRTAGATYEQIAETIRDRFTLDAYDRSAARVDVIDSIEKLTDTPATELRDETVARSRWYLRSLATLISNGDADAIAVALRVDMHVAKLVGLYNPLTVQHTGADGGPILIAAAPVIDRDAAVAAALAAVREVVGDPRPEIGDE